MITIGLIEESFFLRNTCKEYLSCFGNVHFLFIHASFEDHLTTSSRAHPSFHIDAAIHHLQLAIYCFRVMEEHLTRDNICHLQPNMNYADVGDLKERRRRYIPEVLVYACHFWVDHLDHGFKLQGTQLSESVDHHEISLAETPAF